MATMIACATILLTHLHQVAANVEDSDEFVTIYSSCTDITEDGMYYIKPLSDGKPLPVICSNGYVMLDGSLDVNIDTYRHYLSSHDYGRLNKDYTMSGLDDLSTYRQWLLFADENTKFNVAKDCLLCEPGQYGDNTVYYLDSHKFCFSASTTSGCVEDTTAYEYHPESCNQCDSGVWTDDNTTSLWKMCNALQLDADHEINHDHISCVAHGLSFHPVISNIRDACSCYKPMENPVLAYQVARSELPLVTASREQYELYGFYVDDNIRFDPEYAIDAEVLPDNRDINIIYLYNSDFKDGTYRIKESGTYIIMEDIIFNFNPPSDDEINDIDNFSPNSIDLDELYWFPTKEQANPINGEYPGLYSYSGAYTLGFFAGITIEANYVTIDLNGHSLSQDRLFYFQQRFFSLIELGSQTFKPGQGPANYGNGNVSAHFVVIKNGELGLSSHHGIHGINNKYVTIRDINVMQFDVAGIQCNACRNVEISDCVIGPQNNDIPVLGRYTHARAFLPRLKQMIDDGYGDQVIQFHNRDLLTINDIINRLINQMDMIYNYMNNGIQYDEDDEEWIATKKLFYNPSGWMDGGSSYGLLMGGNGAQVVGIGARHGATSDIKISNVEIYGIYNQAIEKVKYRGLFGITRLIFFDAIDWNAVSSQILDSTTSIYIGDAYTDATFALNEVTDSWYFVNSLYISHAMRRYVFYGESPDDVFNGLCGSDIQLHSSKGSIGLRIDGTQNIEIDGVYIHHIYNWADLGNEEWCGQYDGPTVGNEDIDIQYGYTGTRSHGLIIDYAAGTLRNIQIENIESYHGEANGMTVYKECDITLENIQVNNIRAGTKLGDGDIEALNLPNLIPRACGVDIRPNTIVNINHDIGILNGDAIIGFETCYDEDTIIEQELIAIQDTNVSSNGNKNMDEIISNVCMIIMAMVVICVMITVFMRKSKKKDITVNEYSPLLV